MKGQHLGVAVNARAEECGAEADLGCALLDGDGVVVRHPHGERVELQLRMPLRVCVAQLTQLAKLGAHGFGIAQIRRHGHQSTRVQVGEAG